VALDELVRSHQARAYNFAMRMCRNVEDAKDILQETFLGMLRSIKDFRKESRFTTWLYRVASNACLKKRRRGVDDPTPEQELSLDELMPRPNVSGLKPDTILPTTSHKQWHVDPGYSSTIFSAVITRLPF